MPHSLCRSWAWVPASSQPSGDPLRCCLQIPWLTKWQRKKPTKLSSFSKTWPSPPLLILLWTVECGACDHLLRFSDVPWVYAPVSIYFPSHNWQAHASLRAAAIPFVILPFLPIMWKEKAHNSAFLTGYQPTTRHHILLRVRTQNQCIISVLWGKGPQLCVHRRMWRAGRGCGSGLPGQILCWRPGCVRLADGLDTCLSEVGHGKGTSGVDLWLLKTVHRWL